MTAARCLIVAGAVTLVLGLVISFPARIAYGWFAPPTVELSGIAGSVWTGRASEGTFGGIYVTDVRWRFRPLSMFKGEAAFALSALPVSGFIDAQVGIGIAGSVRLSKVAAALPIRSLERLVAVSGIDGDIRVQIDHIVLDGGVPVDATGVVDVSNLIIRPLAGSTLGDFRVTVKTAGRTIRGNVEDLSGVLDVSGNIELAADRSYSFTGLIAARPDAPAAVTEQLQYLGSADTDGRRSFRLEGQL